MKQLLLTITLLSASINMSVASSPFQSLVTRPHPTDITIIKQVTAPKHNQFFYAKRAAQAGNVQAKYDLAMMYALGKGVKKDPRKAFNLFHEAARKGHVAAKYCMGVNFEKGIGVKRQYELARYWFKLAAKAGHPYASQRLSSLKKLLKRRRGMQVYAMLDR